VRLTGSDTNTGSTPAAAWRTIQKAADNLVAGDRVYVGSGTYNERVTETTSGTPTNPITYIADTTGAWTGDAAGPVIVTGQAEGFKLQGDYLTIDGFTVINTTTGINLTGGHLGCVIRSCSLYGNKTGITTGAGSSVTIEHNVVSNSVSNPGIGVDIANPVSALVRNNLIYNNQGYGMRAADGTCTVTGNTFYMNGDSQIRSPSNGTLTINNNIIANGVTRGIEVSGAGTFTSTYNLVWGNATGNWAGLVQGTGDVSVDPLFIDPNGADNVLGGANGADDQFQLNSASSPARDVGSAAAGSFAFTDGSTQADRTTRTDNVLDGTSPDGATVNLGFHYTVTVPALPNLAINDGRLYYGVGSNPQPGMRTWNDLGSSWSAESLAPPTGSTIRWTVHQVAPLLTQQQLVGVLSDNGSTTSLDLLRWNGSAWSLDWNSVTIAPSNAGKRGFDIAYEQSSGDAMVVYSNNTSTPRYRTRTAGVWSAEAALPSAPLSGVVQWVQLVSRPGTNEIGLAYSDANGDLAVLVWTDSFWVAGTSATLETNLKTNATTLAVSNRVFDLAYEATSGRLMAAWARLGTNGFFYSTKPAGSATWTTGQVTTAPASVPHFVDLASEAGSNRIAIVTCGLGDGVERMGLATWNGSAWVNAGEYDSQITNANDTAIGDFPAAVAWVGTSGAAVCVYADNQTDTLDWLLWTAGSGWVVQGDVAMTGKGITESVELKTFATGNRVMLLLSDSNSDLFALWTDGTSWNTTNGGSALTLSLSSIASVPFSFAIKPQ